MTPKRPTNNRVLGFHFRNGSQRTASQVVSLRLWRGYWRVKEKSGRVFRINANDVVWIDDTVHYAGEPVTVKTDVKGF